MIGQLRCHQLLASFVRWSALDPGLLLEGHTFNDFSKAPPLMERGKAWTEIFLRNDQGQLLRSFPRRFSPSPFGYWRGCLFRTHRQHHPEQEGNSKYGQASKGY